MLLLVVGVVAAVLVVDFVNVILSYGFTDVNGAN